MILQRIALQAAAVSAAVLLCAGPALPETAAEDVELTLPQARHLAQQALAAGQPELALQLAEGLWTADRKSSFAHFVAAHAYAQQGRLGPARRAAGRAYRHAQSDPRRFEAAEFAARLAYDEGRPTLAQIWLRRAVQNAPNAQVEEQLGQDYGRVRQENPLSFSLRGGLKPSNNVNNGSDSTVNTINDIPTGSLPLTGASVALAGLVGSVDANLSYRLRASQKSQTDLNARLYIQRVDLTDSAQEIADDEGLGNRDFGLTYASVGLAHLFSIGQTGSASFGLTVSQFWDGGEHYSNSGKLEASRHWRIERFGSVMLNGSYEARDVQGRDDTDADIYTLGATVSHVRDNGDRATFSFNLSDTQSANDIVASQSASLSARYSFAEQFGPVKLSASLSLGYASYDRYSEVAGRDDQSIQADASLFFPDYDYMGFAPTLNISARKKSSNFSRFDTREFSVSLGIQSKF